MANLNSEFIEADIAAAGSWMQAFNDANEVYHLAAMADIVPSIERPSTYHHSNVSGTMNVMEACRRFCPQASFVYTASSSCYGKSPTYPTNELEPISE